MPFRQPPLDRSRHGLLLVTLAIWLGASVVARGQESGPVRWNPPCNCGAGGGIPWDVEEGMGHGGVPWADHCTGACSPCYSAPTEQRKRAIVDVCPDGHVNWGCGYSGVPCCTPPCIRWYGSVEAAPLLYDKEDVPFATLGPSGPAVVRTGDLDTLFDGATRFTLGYAFDNYWRLEGLFQGQTEWHDSDAFRDESPNTEGGTGNLFSPFSGFGNPPIVGLDFNDFAEIDLQSEYRDWELFVRYRGPLHAGPIELSTSCGVRFTHIDERFRYFTEANVPAPGGATNEVNVATENRLVGFQIGGLGDYAVSDCWRISVEVKAALCQNLAAQRTVYTNTDENGDTTVFPGEANKGVTAVVGDVLIVSDHQITQHVALRLGYQAIFANGLALRTENFDRNIDALTLGPARLIHAHTAIYHGPLMGLTVAW